MTITIEVIDEIIAATPRQRGRLIQQVTNGAHFIKSGIKYIVCNADEGEPDFKDRLFYKTILYRY